MRGIRPRNARRPLRTMLSVVTVAALLATACAPTAVDTGATDDPDGPEGGTDESALSLWYLSDHEVLVQDAIERFNEDFPDITVDARGVENDPYKTNLQTAMGTEVAPDVWHNWTGGWLQQFVNAGLVAPLDDYMDENQEWADRLAPSALETATFDGSTYAVPTILGAAYVWYRTDIFDEHGLEVPETYDEFLDVATTLREAGVAPLALANSSSWPGAFYLMYFAARSGGADVFLDAYNREEGGSFEDEAFIEAGERIQELVEMDAFIQGFNGLNYDTGGSRTALYSGDAAMELMGDWTLNAIREESPDLEENFDFFTFPMIEGGSDTEVLVGGANGAFSVSADSQNPEAAQDLVRYLSDQDAAQSVVDEALGTPAVTDGVQIDDPFMQRFVESVDDAEFLQLYYDQFLPPDLAQTHLDTTQQLFGSSMTPQEAAQTMEAQAEEQLPVEGLPEEPEPDPDLEDDEG